MSHCILGNWWLAVMWFWILYHGSYHHQHSLTFIWMIFIWCFVLVENARWMFDTEMYSTTTVAGAAVAAAVAAALTDMSVNVQKKKKPYVWYMRCINSAPKMLCCSTYSQCIKISRVCVCVCMGIGRVRRSGKSEKTLCVLYSWVSHWLPVLKTWWPQTHTPETLFFIIFFFFFCIVLQIFPLLFRFSAWKKFNFQNFDNCVCVSNGEQPNNPLTYA